MKFHWKITKQNTIAWNWRTILLTLARVPQKIWGSELYISLIYRLIILSCSRFKPRLGQLNVLSYVLSNMSQIKLTWDAFPTDLSFVKNSHLFENSFWIFFLKILPFLCRYNEQLKSNQVHRPNYKSLTLGNFLDMVSLSIYILPIFKEVKRLKIRKNVEFENFDLFLPSNHGRQGRRNFHTNVHQ